eukprot:gb/GECH01012378.1/.p1 GENE.gb/GECH01012378.1/~~gb/GECH01012378.1/.p1  ORF type:complete len:274 (+),score=67.34 gb/GECH01012378.1/:1-822(+)
MKQLKEGKSSTEKAALKLVLACEEFSSECEKENRGEDIQAVIRSFSKYIASVVGIDLNSTSQSSSQQINSSNPLKSEEKMLIRINTSLASSLKHERNVNQTWLQNVDYESKLKEVNEQLQAMNLRLSADKYALIAELRDRGINKDSQLDKKTEEQKFNIYKEDQQDQQDQEGNKVQPKPDKKTETNLIPSLNIKPAQEYQNRSLTKAHKLEGEKQPSNNMKKHNDQPKSKSRNSIVIPGGSAVLLQQQRKQQRPKPSDNFEEFIQAKRHDGYK